jgi:hypothetical protein
MNYYRLVHYGGADGLFPDEVWNLELDPNDNRWWKLEDAQPIGDTEEWLGFVDCGEPRSDFPFCDHLLHVHSQRMQDILSAFDNVRIQYLTLKIHVKETNESIQDYAIANYLDAVDCLDRTHSKYEIWTKENLMFWEDRPWMLGQYRDIWLIYIDPSVIGDRACFWLKGSSFLIINEEVKTAFESEAITGCRYVPLIAYNNDRKCDNDLCR